MKNRLTQTTRVFIVFAFYVWVVGLLIFGLNIISQPAIQSDLEREWNNKKKRDDKLYLNEREFDMSDDADDVDFADALLKQEELVCGVNRIRQCKFNISDVKWREIHRRGYFLPPAYFDDRIINEPFIRIIAQLPSDSSGLSLSSFYCRIELCNGFVVTISALIYPFTENFDAYYGMYMVSCPMKGVEPNVRYPCNVTILVNSPLDDAPNVTLPVMTWEKSRGPDGHIAVCVPPLWGELESEKLVEFVELHRILGVEHFFFYNYAGDTSEFHFNSNSSAVLDYYTQVGIATSYQWSLPVSKKSVYNFGQLATIHHCLYSTMYRYK